MQEPKSPASATQPSPQCSKVLSSRPSEDSNVDSNYEASGDDGSDDGSHADSASHADNASHADDASHADSGTIVSQQRALPVCSVYNCLPSLSVVSSESCILCLHLILIY